MNINYEYPVMIFRKDNQFGTNYSVGLSKKKQDGDYENGYMPIRFKKGVELDNQAKIFMKKAFLTFYIGGNPKRTIPYIMCTEYEEAKFNRVEEKTEQKTSKEASNDPYEEFGKEISIDENDLPF